MNIQNLLNGTRRAKIYRWQSNILIIMHHLRAQFYDIPRSNVHEEGMDSNNGDSKTYDNI